ncbi:MAG: carbohydrate kinase [Clostridia bacterium]|nr:carbohydrate kinase [Clostridia bacterium]
MKIAGLDIGTTGCKCTVFDEGGKYLGKAYRDYPVRRRVTGHEIDVSTIMDGVVEAIREMAGRYPDIGGIGITSFGETCVMTDGEGTPLHNAMLYTDPRGGEEVKALSEKLGEMHIARVTGLRPHEMYSLPKLMWLKAHEPALYARAKHIFLMQDYVVYHLTGTAQIDYSLATRTMALDIGSLQWSREMFDAAGIDMRLMSKPVPTGTPAGTLTEKAARAVGLPRTVTVVSVSHDQVAAAVGAGAFDGSVAVDGAGTTECLTPIYDEMPDIEEMYKGYFSVVPYVIPGKYVAYAFSYTGGALIDWCVRQLAKAELQAAKAQGISPNELLEQAYAEEHGDEPSGLLVLPHFAGAATPYMDTGAKGAVLGLTVDTGVAELYRGCMEGVAYEMVLNARVLKDSGIRFTRLHATGGGARSALWMQMKADMLNIPIVALRTADAGTVGSAMLTGVAIGAFRDLQDAARHMVEEIHTYEPRAEMHAKYMEIYERYEKVYGAVRPLV